MTTTPDPADEFRTGTRLEHPAPRAPLAPLEVVIRATDPKTGMTLDELRAALDQLAGLGADPASTIKVVSGFSQRIKSVTVSA